MLKIVKLHKNTQFPTYFSGFDMHFSPLQIGPKCSLETRNGFIWWFWNFHPWEVNLDWSFSSAEISLWSLPSSAYESDLMCFSHFLPILFAFSRTFCFRLQPNEIWPSRSDVKLFQYASAYQSRSEHCSMLSLKLNWFRLKSEGLQNRAIHRYTLISSNFRRNFDAYEGFALRTRKTVFCQKIQNKDDFWRSYTFLMTLRARKKSLIGIAFESASIFTLEVISCSQKL